MKGILFRTKLVREIQADRKNQTRRPMKLPPKRLEFFTVDEIEPFKKQGYAILITNHDSLEGCIVGEPEYKEGDICYVRETFAEIPSENGKESTYIYRSDHQGEPPQRWTPSLFMPKKAARIFLEITSVTPELLTEISEEDARAEGIEPREGRTAVQDFKLLWESIHGKRSFRKDVAVWRYEFKQISKPK